jgi:hypothetical protein
MAVKEVPFQRRIAPDVMSSNVNNQENSIRNEIISKKGF